MLLHIPDLTVRRRRLPFAAVVSGLAAALAGVLLAGCGEFNRPVGTPPSESAGTAVDSAAPPRTKTAASLPSTPPSPPAPPVTDSGRALRAGDYLLAQGPETSGFTVEDADQSDYTKLPEQEFADCLGVPVELVRDRSEQTAYGQLIFDEQTGLALSSTAAIVSNDVLTSDLATIARTEYPGCLAEFAGDVILQQVIGDAGEGSGVSIGVVRAEAAPPPAGATARVNTVLSVSDATGELLEIYYDIVSVYEGRVAATIYANGVDPLDERIVAAATAQVVEKVRRQ